MSEIRSDLSEIEKRIADARENLRELIEQAAAFSGAADEELMSERIAEQETRLENLTKQRDEIFRQKS